MTVFFPHGKKVRYSVMKQTDKKHITMKAYKGFFKSNDGRIYCAPNSAKFYYKEGETYELPEGEEPKICVRGFHACTFPMDVFWHYSSNMGNVEFHEVELEGAIGGYCGDSKFCAPKITIGRKITPEEMLEISIKMMLEDKDKYFKGNNVAIVRKDAKWNCIGKDGKLLSETWFDYVHGFFNGFSIVEKDLKQNFINTEGKLLSKEWFDYVDGFFNGFSKVKKGEKYNRITTDGKLLSEEWF